MGPAAKTEDRWHQILPNTIKCTLQKNVASIIHDSFVSFCSLGRARAASASRPACRRHCSLQSLQGPNTWESLMTKPIWRAVNIKLELAWQGHRGHKTDYTSNNFATGARTCKTGLPSLNQNVLSQKKQSAIISRNL